MKLNGRIYNPGNLRTPIVIATITVAKSSGFPVETAVYLAEVKADWENAHGSEARVANANGAIEPATVRIRYRSGIDNTCVVFIGATVTEILDVHGAVTGHTISGGTKYAVKSVNDIQNRHEYIDLYVEAVKAG